MSNSSTIKVVTTQRYEVRLLQLETGKYCLGVELAINEKTAFSEPLDDLGTAMQAFDNKVLELEGN